MNTPLFPSLPPLAPQWRNLSNALLDALFPPRCAGCGAWSRALFCADCAPQLRMVRAPLCDHCGVPFDPLAYAAPICADCRTRTPHFRAARAACHFEGPLRAAIHRLKYHQKRAIAPKLAPILADAIARDAFLRDFRPDLLVPVPLHRARLKKRGFNQSFLLAHELSALLGVPTRQLLLRTRNTPPQVGLKGKARLQNVRGAFAPCNLHSDWQNARLLLIDDVFTTGSTLGEAAKTLLAAGAGEVCALTLAR